MNYSDPFHTILHPKTVVIAGASNNPMKMGTLQAMNVLRNGFEGEVFFLHPKEKKVLGRPAFAHAADLPLVPDLALLVTPAPITVKVLEELGERGVRHAIVTTAGFREVGDDGVELEKKLTAIADRYGIRFVGPNCIGVLNTHHPLNTTVLPTLLEPGPMSLVSQSGTFVSQLPVLFERDGIRLGKAISVGNSSNTDLVDWLDYMGRDEKTKAIALYIEGITDPRRFVEVASRVTRIKPVFALYSGSTDAGKRAGHSHTAALGGPDRLYQTMFDQAGVVRAPTVTELFDWAWTAAVMPPPKGKRMGIITHSGGPATCMADECGRVGLEVPPFSEELQGKLREHVLSHAAVGNPIDMTFFMETEVFCDTLPRLVMESGEVDAILIHGLMDTGFAQPMMSLMEDRLPLPMEDLLEGLKADVTPLLDNLKKHEMPGVGSTFVWKDHANEELLKNSFPVFPCPYRTVHAMKALLRVGQILERPEAKLLANGDLADPLPAGFVEALPAGPQDEAVSRTIFDAYGIPVSPYKVTDSVEGAVLAASQFDGELVVKGLAPGVAHKSEGGFVALRVAPDDVANVCSGMLKRGATQFLITSLVKGARELVAGLTRRPGFGPVVMLGLGGVLAEGLDDVVFRMTPLHAQDVESMIEGLRSHKVFGDYRHMKKVNATGLMAVMQGLTRLANDHPEISEVDVNPLIVTDEGEIVAVDALIVKN